MIGTRVVSLKKPHGIFTFGNIKEKPVLSLLRDFSAPVRLIYPYTDAELLFLLAHDGDPFNRWEAAQKLFAKYLLGMIERRSTVVPRAAQDLFAALRALLRDARIDAAFKAFALSLPSEAELGLALRAKGLFIDPYAIYAARKAMILALGRALRADLASARKKLETLDPNAVDGASMGKRSLKNLCLATLAADHNPRELGVVFKQATAGKNMTDRAAALAILSDAATPLRVRAFAAFEERWRKNPTVMDKWLGLQASARRADVLAIVQKLMRHPAFDLKNPNRVSALIGAFASNSLGFHKPDGSGYRFVAETIKAVDRVNPQSAVRLAQAFARWRDYEPKRRALMKKALNDLAAHKLLSANCREVVSKSIGKN